LIPSADILAVAALVVCAAYVVFGLTGFGSTVLALPLLAHLMPLKFAVALLLLLDLAMGIAFNARGRRGVRTDELAWLAPFMLAGIAGGLTLLVRLPERELIGALGIFVLAYSAWGVLRRGAARALSRLWCAPIGLAGGAFSALFGTGGVLFVIYTSGRLRDAAELRATTAATILLSVSVRALLFFAMGLFAQQGLLTHVLVLAPAALVGLLIGLRWHAKVEPKAVIRAVHLLLAVAGVSLLARSLGG
jgi:uncharacterized membrane protein YfcA